MRERGKHDKERRVRSEKRQRHPSHHKEEEENPRRFPYISLVFTLVAIVCYGFAIGFIVAGDALIADAQAGGMIKEGDFWGSIFGTMMAPVVASGSWQVALYFLIPAIILTPLFIIGWFRGW
jgi:hypothetical protein